MIDAEQFKGRFIHYILYSTGKPACGIKEYELFCGTFKENNVTCNRCNKTLTHEVNRMKTNSETQFDERGCAYVKYSNKRYDSTFSLNPKLKYETLTVNVDVDNLGHLIGVELITTKKKEAKP